jgi:dTDP-glucose 4,6-dehydratase
MKVRSLLVTGGAGFIGSSFVELALKSGYRVRVLDALTYAGHLANLEHLPQGAVEVVQGDIRDRALVLDQLQRTRATALVNFAAESHVDRSISGPAVFIETNVLGTCALLQASSHYWSELSPSAKESFRYLQISTDEVFGALGPDGRFSEATPYAPNSPYSASKASGDHLVRAWKHTYGLPTLITNCSNNYGPRQFPEKLIPRMIQCAIQGEPLPVYGDGSNVRDWIHVEDHCRGLMLALEKGIPGETYCFGGNAERRNLDVVKMICRELDHLRPRGEGNSYESSITFVEDRMGHDWRYAIDDAKAQVELGFTRNYDFETGLTATVQWYLDHQDWVQTVLAKRVA